MQKESVLFSRSMLSETMGFVSDYAEAKGLTKADIKEASVFKMSSLTVSDIWEFRFKGFYWSGDADNAYDARVKGWEAFLTKEGYF
jgi:hypothetical protein